MYKFGKSSEERLKTCHPRIQEILYEAIQIVDFSVLCGHRNQADQDDVFHKGMSKVKFPNSKHNSLPSLAVDVAPYPIDWNNLDRFTHLIGIIRGIAHARRIKIRCGIDWDSDGDITDHSFMDYPHFELVE